MIGESWGEAGLVLRAGIGFALGAVIGSWLAVMLIRWPVGRSSLSGRSSCDDCAKTLRMRELVPILSFAIARGRCGGCGAPIDRRHPAMEVAAGLVGVVAVLAHPWPLLMVTAAFGWWLLLLAALDLEHHWLPDRLTLPLIPLGLGAAWLGVGPELDDRLMGAVIGYGVLALLALGYRYLRGREGLGGGDPKLFAALGAWLGWQQLPLILLGASLTGLAVLALRRARGGRIAATDALPLGTLMALVAWPLWLVSV